MAEEKRVVSIALKKITLDPRTQPRERMDQSVILDYADLVDVLPPVVVFGDGRGYWLADGWHRYRAHEEAGRKHLFAEVRPGGLRDAVLFSCGVNAQHGLRRSNDDKRRAVLVLLKDDEWSKWTNVEIARQCAVSEGMVRQQRAELREKKSSYDTRANDSEEVEENDEPETVADEPEPDHVVDETDPQVCPTCGRPLP